MWIQTQHGDDEYGIWTDSVEHGGGYYLGRSFLLYALPGFTETNISLDIAEFTETGLKFENGSELAADVVVFATGLGNTRDTVRKICGDIVAHGYKRIWGLNAEGEANGAWRDLGVPGLGI
ncbi:hypothetical protein C8J57DRAFT_1538778 [Mycena rebaudengoi]|nr:hypothetical protein C8J57DRAFT_1538778 [Mycena rebaudengoi]